MRISSLPALSGVLLSAGLLLAACGGSSSPSSSPAAGASGAKQYKIGLAAGAVANPTAREVYAGFVNEANKLGMSVKTNDANIDINKQVSDIDQFTAQKVDAIVVHLIGDPNAVKGPLDKARAAGIHVMAFDGGVDGAEMVASQPGQQGGALSADWLGQKLGGKGTVAFLGGPQYPVLQVRWDTAKKTLADKYPGIKVAEQQDPNPDDATNGRKLAESLLAKYPDLSAIWCSNDNIGAGVANAVKAANRNVVITALNADEEGINAIKAGLLNITYDMHGLDLGAKAADATQKILNGTTPKSAFPVAITTDPTPVTKDNVDQWVAPEKRITYPPLS